MFILLVRVITAQIKLSKIFGEPQPSPRIAEGGQTGRVIPKPSPRIAEGGQTGRVIPKPSPRIVDIAIRFSSYLKNRENKNSGKNEKDTEKDKIHISTYDYDGWFD